MDARPRPKNYLDDISGYDIIYIVIYNDLIEVKDINREILLNINSINCFINGVTNDYKTVINSLIYDFSNGVVEAAVNKLKLVKRIMYGPEVLIYLNSK